MSWTDERVELLKKLWSEGLSASQIAGRLGSVTRNAVIGKVCRLKLPRRATTKREVGAHSTVLRNIDRAHRPRPPKPAIAMPLPTPDAAHDIARKSLAELGEHECKWPVGHPGDPGFGFCAFPKYPGLPYCENHAMRAYRAPKVATPRTGATVEASEPSPVSKQEDLIKA